LYRKFWGGVDNCILFIVSQNNIEYYKNTYSLSDIKNIAEELKPELVINGQVIIYSSSDCSIYYDSIQKKVLTYKIQPIFEEMKIFGNGNIFYKEDSATGNIPFGFISELSENI
jgi:hypothetical protein